MQLSTADPDTGGDTVQQLVRALLARYPVVSIEVLSPDPGVPALLEQAAPSGDLDRLGIWIGRLAATGAVPALLTVVGADVRRAAEAGTVLGLLSALLPSLVANDVAVRRSSALVQAAVEDAARDPMTALGNRRAWVAALRAETARVGRGSAEPTVLVVDLDGLKSVNDTRGHAAGDAVIVAAATALREMCRDMDTVCRLGGDEFGVLAPETPPEEGAALAARVEQRLARLDLAASVGSATAFPGENLMQAWERADMSMYRAKSRTAGR